MNADLIAQAVTILRDGRVVAFPTETVYGLAADATNTKAVRRIFQVKGRPLTNPLIVHVADSRVARRYAAAWPVSAQRLTERFWPGPLTIVLPRVLAGPARVCDEVSAGGTTIGLRAPDHALALELLRRFDGALAAPSANRSTRVSPTTAQHVRDEFGEEVELILDGGACRVGIESTVLDLSAAAPRILRLGNVSREQIEKEIGHVDVFAGTASIAVASASPGQQAVHYAPRTPAYRFETFCREKVDTMFHGKKRLALLRLGVEECVLPGTALDGGPCRKFDMPGSPAQYARELYRMVRMLDESGVNEIWIEMPPDLPEWAAVRDRIRRATKTLPV